MRLLVLEDDAQLGEALSAGLRGEGHVVDWFTSGAQADVAMSDTGYDAVVLDLGLPDADGLVWLQRWRAAGRSLPILVLTARDTVDQRIEGLDVGADDYLIKPISLSELDARLRAVMRRASGRSAQPDWVHGALSYNPASKAVQWRSQVIDLTAREVILLEVFLKNPRKVLSKGQLLEQLYDWRGGEPESNALEVHIHHLRRKIAPQVVRTIRGLGYTLGSIEELS
jgi:two-component system response regulator QseB